MASDSTLYEVEVTLDDSLVDDWPDGFATLNFLPQENPGVVRFLLSKDQLDVVKTAGVRAEIIAKTRTRPLNPHLLLSDAAAVQRTADRVADILSLGPR